jgi:hypothetical protein
MRQIRVALLGITISALSLLVTTAPALAWYGAVHVTTSNTTDYAGWVDGNGPDSYTFAADCNDGGTAFGVTRWAGDRRGSDASCAGHGGIVAGSNHRFIILSS